MIRKIHPAIFAVLIFLVFFLVASAWAHNKVVVIPLTEEAPPLEPFAPLAAVSPPTSAYTVGTTTVTDKVTSLVWQKSDDNTPRSWDAAWTYCQTLELPTDGWTDWRLPSVAELMSIVYYGTYDPAINGAAFPGTDSSYYWSATTDASNSGRTLSVYFSKGSVSYSNRISPSTCAAYVVCPIGRVFLKTTATAR